MKPRVKRFVLWFEEINKDDVDLVGGKTANLGEMTVKTQIPVPYGFATTAAAYYYFIKKAKLEKKIAKILKELKDLNDTLTLQKVGRAIRKLILKAKMPSDLEEEIKGAYRILSKRYGRQAAYVAIRSSATAEDLPDASFAGQQDTYLNIKGEKFVAEKIKECYSSLFTDRAIFYRAMKGFNHLDIALSAVVQLMIFSKAAGVIFTLNVANGDPNFVLIESGYGLGEFIVQGKIIPDEYLVSKRNLKIVSKKISRKNTQLICKPEGGTMEASVSKELQDKPVLTDNQIVQLAKFAVSIEKHYGKPMDIEWGLDGSEEKLWILQARPETFWAQKKREPKLKRIAVTNREVLIHGLPASPGLVGGEAHVIFSVKNINEFQGGILVTEMTAPDWVPAMKKADAIVTNSGGMTCHAAIVSRELGIPCIVGTSSRGKAATEVIANGDKITVDASNGVVYKGILEEVSGIKERMVRVLPNEVYPVTGTKILVNLGDPELAERVAQLPCDGVGLMREEFIWATSIGQHPLYLIEMGQPEVVINSLAEGIRKICHSMHPRPVVLRFSDFKTNEYRDLKGGDKYELEERSPLLGWRGASRHYDPKYRDAFKLEVKAVKKVREEFGLKNLWVMLPFVRNVNEVRKIIKMIEEEGLSRGPDFKIWLMAEIPSNVILADKFNEFIDGYSIGSNDLTMLILGCDRDDAAVAHIFDERDLAVKRAIKHLIDVAHKDGKTVSICGQAPSVHGPEYIRFLIESGIDSISVNPDAVIPARKWVASIEQKLILEKAIGYRKKEETELNWDI